MNKKLAIISAGGQGKVVGEIALLNQYDVIDFFDDEAINYTINEIKKFPFKICGNLDQLKNNLKNYDAFFAAIGDSKKRYDKISWLKKEKVNIVSLIHPKSTISKFSTIGNGTCVMANAVVNPGTLIKEGAIINTSASVDHDCVIENYAHVSANCTISGGVSIGKFTLVGVHTAVHPGIHVGNNVKIGIGSKVYKNILDDKVFTD